ncbi:MAG: helix-turn-helix domain-containing protein [Isosphaeraceae bacterium]
MATPRTRTARKPDESKQGEAAGVGGGRRPRSRSRAAAGAAYFELVRRFPLRLIESEAELERARSILNELLDREALDRDRADYLDVLGDLIGRYEEAHHPLPPISEVDMLRHLLDARRLTRADVARGAGISVSSLASILAGRRRMSRDHIEALARFFRISPAVFLRSQAEGL